MWYNKAIKPTREMLDMKETIAILIEKIKYEVDLIEEYIRSGEYNGAEFDEPGSFQIAISNEEVEEKTQKLWGRKGIYIFLTTSEFDFPQDKIIQWNSCSGALINSQDSVNGNIVSFSIEKDQIFYIGSCYSESLLTRIRQHCNNTNSTQTASLKMGDKHREWVKEYLEVYYFPIKKKYTENELHIIITGIEKELHNRYETIAGSSRT